MDWKKLEAQALFDVSHSLLGEWLAGFSQPWEALPGIGEQLLRLIPCLSRERYEEIAPDVWVAKTASIARTAELIGPCIIGENTEIRPGAYLRGKILVGEGAVIGNSTELKNVILFDGVQVPHYNYVGDAILGYKAHMGAGSITSNVKADRRLVIVHAEGENQPTRLKKFGALLGDYAEIGCNAVLNPGTIIGRNATVYPLTSVRGYVPEGCICKQNGAVVIKQKRD